MSKMLQISVELLKKKYCHKQTIFLKQVNLANELQIWGVFVVESVVYISMNARVQCKTNDKSNNGREYD